MYPETCHRNRCAALHLAGRKRDFDFGLAAPEQAGDAGLLRIGVGALLLADVGLEPSTRENAALRDTSCCWPSTR